MAASAARYHRTAALGWEDNQRSDSLPAVAPLYAHLVLKRCSPDRADELVKERQYFKQLL